MSAALNPHITISSPFSVADLPTLFVWKNRLHRLNGEPEEKLDAFMDEHLVRTGVKTFAAYRDGELGAYFEAIPGELTFPADESAASVSKVEMVFKRQFHERRPEQENGAGSGRGTTKTALNLVLRELFEMNDLVFFPLRKADPAIHRLCLSVGALCIGLVDEGVSLFILSRLEWERVNAVFITEYEATYPVYGTMDAEAMELSG